MPTPARTVRALVAGLVDFAGLFPPASLDMSEAVLEYASYLASQDAWMLGRLVVPVARLDELSVAVARLDMRGASSWHIAAIGSGEPDSDGAAIRDFNARESGRLLVDVLEQRAATADAVRSVARATPAGLTLYVEIPIAHEPEPLLQAVRAAGVRAKVRTGGIVADAFPSTAALARFIVRCAKLGVPFKATAGLHHPLRAEYPLTYLPDAARGTMFGFLALFAAAAFARAGEDDAMIAQLLEERDPSSFVFSDDVLRWRAHAVSLDALTQARASLALSFGSCSFREPVGDLRHLHLIPS